MSSSGGGFYQPSGTRNTLIECAGNSCSNRWPRRVGRVAGGAVDLGDEDVVLHGRLAQLDRGAMGAVAIAVDHREREPRAARVARATPAPRPSYPSPCSRRCRARMIVFLVANRRIVEGVRVSALKG
jgi:hypothetical protein